MQLQQLNLDHRFIDSLPADEQTGSRVRQVRNACYSFVNPTPVSQPRLLAHSREMLETLGLDSDAFERQDFVQLFSGNQMLPGMRPHAMCYGGHQFGHWAGQLGDGRAIILGDIKNDRGELWSLQLKGSGMTPYSRRADGLAVLRSSLREFVCSEAMYHLGVPTTRALSLMTTGESVVRDMFYDGHPRYEPGAIVCRVAPSFLRFGNFQILTAQGDVDNLRRLVDFTIENYFPHLGRPQRDVYIEFFREVCRLTAVMIAHWMRVGFVHGVMNTDNMSILGLTIDYGPYGWLEDFDPDWTPNTTDANGRRYRFGQQPMIAQWNLMQLAEALFPLIDDPRPLEDALQYYSDVYERETRGMMAAKLGFAEANEDTDKLSRGLIALLMAAETDMTLFYRCLSALELHTAVTDVNEQYLKTHFAPAWYRGEQINAAYLQGLIDWLGEYQALLQTHAQGESERVATMNRTNPKFVFRNYIAQQAIDKAEQGDLSMLHELLEVYRHPYAEQSDKSVYTQRRPEWARHRAGCSMLSCSS
jgi:uncharacterized protein YdiU (UPF0061 family)